MPIARRLFVGLMSGTSLDGVDAALVDFSTSTPVTLATRFAPFDASLRVALLNLQSKSANELHESALAANQLAHAYADAVQALLAMARLEASAIEAIGAHGQTVRHRPELGFTIQLNNPALLAELTGITVCADFRSRDVAAGGQGAPLAPAFHQAVFSAPTGARAIVNVGGIANLTRLPATGAASGAGVGDDSGLLIGFDTGPGNGLMDLWVQRHQGQPYDTDGEWAASGRVLPTLLKRLLADPYFSLPPPKSTGRDLFHAAWLEQFLDGGERPADVQATLCALTAVTITQAITNHAGAGLAEAYVCGGGAHNAQLLKSLREHAPTLSWHATDTLGVPADWVEAVAFAWLARRLIDRQPGSIASVTGARGERLLGAIYPADLAPVARTP